MTGQQAKERRTQLGKSLRAVAARAGITHPTLLNFERNPCHRLHPHLQVALDDALSAFENERNPKLAPAQHAA